MAPQPSSCPAVALAHAAPVLRSAARCTPAASVAAAVAAVASVAGVVAIDVAAAPSALSQLDAFLPPLEAAAKEGKASLCLLNASGADAATVGALNRRKNPVFLAAAASIVAPATAQGEGEGEGAGEAAAASPHVFAGVFEWYSWRTKTLMSTGFGLSAGASRTRRKKAWRNCTATGARTNPADPCTGPVGFAKGPLVMWSTAAVRAVVHGPLFARDVAQAHLLAEGKAKAYKGPGSGRIDDDVQVGYWMSQLPRLTVFTFRRYMAWHDRWKQGVTDMLSRLLLAHKVPWANFADLLDRTEAMWLHSPEARASIMCEGPPCADCAHVTDQSACIIDVELAQTPAQHLSNRSCWPRCRFTKAVPPVVPAQCWNRSTAAAV